jgi:hypothetical protein
MPYTLDTKHLTVVRIDRHGERWDLNARGAPCITVAELRDFIVELHRQGAYDERVRDELLANLQEE